MITTQLARELIPFVNSIEYPIVQKFIDSRISSLKESIMNTSDMNGVLRLQGAYEELRRIRSLKEIVDTDKGN